jgi:pimeloyl-ACP methyl ester carboxylesterase
VRAGGVRLHHRSAGRGRDVVLLHGLAADLSFWYLRYVPLLARDRRVITFDLRGHGLSSTPRSGYTTRQMARDLLRLMDGLGVARADVAGHSYGGAVALHAALLAPERVRTVALVDARVPSLQPLLDQDERDQWGQMRTRVRRRGGRVTREVPQVAYSYLDELARLEGTARHGLPATGRFAADRWRTLLETTTALQDLARPAGLTARRIAGLPHPVLAVYGELSHCLPTARKITALLPATELEVVPGAGHFHPIAHPHQLAGRLSSFWDRHAEAPVVPLSRPVEEG